ncbi:hypothetical protein B0I08_10432 [Glaciihabitans tibetensis]|uniref:Uncharacterized protein n=1 Tax=Glaciihabitans tibetensis TaxID=1266600 RepID=A0A2T0VDT1_9MICO|nr:hypothetical protein [Glaciihabitans tibetensis]PRY68330.1 hypothetical protein B0I08_10432 [Glaciihabitans tibetensis]
MARRAEVSRNDSPGAPPVPLADSLSSDELNFRADPPKRPREPIPVLVWLRFTGTPVQAPAECLEFTSKAALVRYTRPGKTPEQVWVWANAVTRQSQQQPVSSRRASPGPR